MALFSNKPAKAGARKPQPRLAIDHGDFHTVVNQHGCFAVDPTMRHRHAVDIVMKGEPHEPKTVEFIASRCGKGDVIQAGVFFGDFMPALSSRVSEGALIWGFEPSPRNHFLAAKTIQLNAIENVRLKHAALSAEPAEMDLVIEYEGGKELGGLSHLVGSGRTGENRIGRTVKVQTVPLDNEVPADRAVSIIQLDVEGHEIEALKGARRIVQDNHPILILEGPIKNSELRQLFPEIGYKQVGLLHKRNRIFLPDERIR